MAESEEASWLRQIWGEQLFRYNKKWIAIKGTEIISSAFSHDDLVANLLELNPSKTFMEIDPLIAFVFLDELQ